MVRIITYPQRLFDRMVENEKYSSDDFFLSIVHHNITEEEMPKRPQSLNHMIVKFDDVVADVLGNKVITPEQAEAIVRFTYGIPDNVTVHIHCGAGVSRSTAAAKAIEEILDEAGNFGCGCDTQWSRLGDSYHPNPTVYNLIIQAHKQNKK